MNNVLSLKLSQILLPLMLLIYLLEHMFTHHSQRCAHGKKLLDYIYANIKLFPKVAARIYIPTSIFYGVPIT